MSSEKDKAVSLVIESLFFARRMNNILKRDTSDRTIKITGRAWQRHWRRVQKAIDIGVSGLSIPEDVIRER